MIENVVLNCEGIDEKTAHQFMLWCAMRTLQRCQQPNPKWVQCLYIKQDWLDGYKTLDELKRAQAWVNSIAWGEVNGARWGTQWPATRDEQWRAMETVCWALSEHPQGLDRVAFQARLNLDPTEKQIEIQTQAHWLDEARADYWQIWKQQQRQDLLDYLASLGDRDERLLYAFGR